jgi:peptidoglycan/LPS O-acetylase OafA/YrhL
MVYRPEIDGLRALAVTIVVLFHAQFEWIKGGYVGVDVFFVISGYLITTNLLRTGIPSFGTFYARRIRRLFPAVLATSVITLIAAIFVMGPVDLAKAAKSAVFAITSTSNIGFWLDTGYWDTDAKLKPLLHTWSLSVEEQFYLIWPLLIFLSMKLGRLGVMLVMTAILIVGFAVSAWFVNINSAAVFYLTPFRVYQFAIGAILATLFYWRGEKGLLSNALIRELALLAGLALILVPAVIYDGTAQYLGALAAVPCFGAMLIIAGGRSKVFGALLDNPVCVYIGKISYSLYLVHWPLMALYSYVILRKYNITEQIGMIAATLVLGMLLFYSVEQRFRKPAVSADGVPTPAVKFNGVVGGLASLCVAGAAFLWVSPLDMRPAGADAFDVELPLYAVNAERHALLPSECFNNRSSCYDLDPDRKNIVVLGDSHGIDGYTIMKQLYGNANIVLAATNGCDMLVGLEALYEDEELRRKCQSDVDALFGREDIIKGADLFVLSFAGNAKTNPQLLETIEYLQDQSSAEVLVLGPSPIYSQDLTQIIRKAGLTPRQAVIPDEFVLRLFWETNKQLLAAQNSMDFVYADKVPFFCANDECKASLVSIGDVPISFDKHHLSFPAAVEFGRYLRGQGLDKQLSLGAYDPLPDDLISPIDDLTVFSGTNPNDWVARKGAIREVDRGMEVVYEKNGSVYAFNRLKTVKAGETYLAKVKVYSAADARLNIRIARIGGNEFEQTAERKQLVAGENDLEVSHTFLKDQAAARINLDVSGLEPITIEVLEAELTKLP